ncbi:hypothetical protein GA0070620_6084 [Micromonospora krabiensis]|uniref:Uncharacterized protein n=1 Tax=Micromonospora krabiensis TaxID=307121 RepID=A0A1C3ND14_9ACTN|nr:hypothetical protein GA0070620_6084 [Micromonospora krabiensis]
MTGRRPLVVIRGLLPYPGRVLVAAIVALLFTLPALDATRYAGWRADLRTVILASVVVAAAGAFVLAARYGARPPADPARFPVRLAVAVAGSALLAAAYLGAAWLLHRLVVPLAVDGPVDGLPARGLVSAVLAGAFGVAVGVLWRHPAVLAALAVLLVAAELTLAGAGGGPVSAVRFWLLGVGHRHDVPGCVSVVPAECVTWTHRYWPAGLTLAATVAVAVLAAAVVAARGRADERAEPSAEPTPVGRDQVGAAPGPDAGPAPAVGGSTPDAGSVPDGAPPRPRAVRWALAAGLVVVGLAATPALIGTGVRHATGDLAVGVGRTAPTGSPVEVSVATPGRLAVFAVGLVAVRDCHAESPDGTRVDLAPLLGTVSYGDSISYRWVGTLRLPEPGRWTVRCAGESGEYLVADPPRVSGLVGRLVEAPRPVGWLLGVLPGLLLAAHAAVGGRWPAWPARAVSRPAR